MSIALTSPKKDLRIFAGDNHLLFSPLHHHPQTMKILLLAIIGVLLYNSNDARFFISDQLQNASEFVRPDPQLNIRY